MTTQERVSRMYAHREADRVPITDSPWAGTVRRWKREGMPADADWREYFGVDKFESIGVDVSPRYPERILEESETHYITETKFGVTLKYIKGEDTTPEFLDYKIHSPATWAEAKKRIDHDPARINWDYIQKNYPLWRADGRWVTAEFWFGFDVTHSWMVGTETLLIAMLEEPDWAADMFHNFLDTNIALFDRLWDEGFRFDEISFPDDMGYKNNQFFSLRTYRELVKPAHKRAFDWARNRGIHTRLHSCGFIEPFIPDLIDIGLECLNPLEVKAGMDPFHIKRTYGDRLVLNGGVNAVLWDKPDEILTEIDRVVPVLKEKGGYIFSSDHSIPNTVSLRNFKAIVERVKTVGAY